MHSREMDLLWVFLRLDRDPILYAGVHRTVKLYFIVSCIRLCGKVMHSLHIKWSAYYLWVVTCEDFINDDTDYSNPHSYLCEWILCETSRYSHNFPHFTQYFMKLQSSDSSIQLSRLPTPHNTSWNSTHITILHETSHNTPWNSTHITILHETSHISHGTLILLLNWVDFTLLIVLSWNFTLHTLLTLLHKLRTPYNTLVKLQYSYCAHTSVQTSCSTLTLTVYVTSTFSRYSLKFQSSHGIPTIPTSIFQSL